MKHYFNPSIAAKIDLSAAVVFNTLKYFIDANKEQRNIVHFKQGRWWTIVSIDNLQKRMLYLSNAQVRKAVDKLISAGLIIKGNFNHNQYDRTNWYSYDETRLKNVETNYNSIVEKETFAPEIEIAKDVETEPIAPPPSPCDIEKPCAERNEYRAVAIEIIDKMNVLKPNSTKKVASNIKAIEVRLREYYRLDELKTIAISEITFALAAKASQFKAGIPNGLAIPQDMLTAMRKYRLKKGVDRENNFFDFSDYFRVSTIFAASRFGGYINEGRDLRAIYEQLLTYPQNKGAGESAARGGTTFRL